MYFAIHRIFPRVGCSNGILQIFNVSKGYLVKHFSLGCPNIRGLEWIQLTTLFVYFNGSSTSNKSEINHIDVVSGIVVEHSVIFLYFVAC